MAKILPPVRMKLHYSWTNLKPCFFVKRRSCFPQCNDMVMPPCEHLTTWNQTHFNKMTNWNGFSCLHTVHIKVPLHSLCFLNPTPVFIYAKLLQKLLEEKLIRVCDGFFWPKSLPQMWFFGSLLNNTRMSI